MSDSSSNPGYAGGSAPVADPAAQPTADPGAHPTAGTAAQPTAGTEADPTAYEIVRVDESNWRTYRDVRLACLIDSAPWFGTLYPQAARMTDDDWRARASSEHLAFWLAMVGDLPIGTAGLFVDEELDGGMLVGMWVVQRERGSGVAQALVEEVEAEAGRRGCRRFVLHVHAQNTRAQAFYRRLGFVAIGETEGPDGERNELVMEARES